MIFINTMQENDEIYEQLFAFFLLFYFSCGILICMKENLIHYRTSVCNINYHVVWSVKYRRKVLDTEVELYLKDLVCQIAADKGFYGTAF